jgi:hypothetical protein
MAIKTNEMISCWVDFAERASLAANVATGSKTPLNMQYFREFLAKVSAFNDDPSNAESRPYFFINRLKDTGNPIPETELNRLLLDADTQGLAGEFLKDRTEDGDVTLYFSHAASVFASHLCEQYGLGFANLGANGICVPGFVFAGLTEATQDQLKTTLIEARAYLAVSS